MIYVYCPRASDSARDLVNEINRLHGSRLAFRINREDGAVRFLRSVPRVGRAGNRVQLRRPERGDLVVNWGSSIPAGVLAGWNAGGVRVMNPNIRHGKYAQLVRLSEAGVPVPPHHPLRHNGMNEYPGRWLARLNSHHEANDLLQNLTRGDYYTMFLPSSQDLRIHILGGRSIRAGRKIPRNNNPHPEFRSWQAGWKLVYDGDGVRNTHRDAARRAVEALGLDFGAVDVLCLGERPTYAPRGLYGRGAGFVVLEVNTAPGIEGRTLETYARKFMELAARRNN